MSEETPLEKAKREWDLCVAFDNYRFNKKELDKKIKKVEEGRDE